MNITYVGLAIECRVACVINSDCYWKNCNFFPFLLSVGDAIFESSAEYCIKYSFGISSKDGNLLS